MHPVDTLRIQFNADQLVILNLAMAFLMFSVSLDIRLADFRQVVRFPKSVAAGLVVQPTEEVSISNDSESETALLLITRMG